MKRGRAMGCILLTTVLTLSAFFSSCAPKGGTAGETVENAGGTQGLGALAYSGEIGARIEEYPVPDPDKKELEKYLPKGGISLPPILYRDGIVIITSSASLCAQFYSFASKKWTTVPMDEKYEKDGETYGGYFMVTATGDGKGLYCRTYQEEKGKRTGSWLASLGADGSVGELGPECSTLLDGVTEPELKVFIDSAGRGYVTQQHENVMEIQIFDENMQLQATEEIEGILCGMAEDPTTSQMIWYGTDPDGDPVIGRPGEGAASVRKLPGLSVAGKVVEERGTGEKPPSGDSWTPKNIFSMDFYAAYSEAGDLYLIDQTNVFLIGEQESVLVLNYRKNGYTLQDLYGAVPGPGRSIRVLAQLDGELCVLTIDPDYEGTLPVKQDIELALPMQNLALEHVAAIFNRRNTDYRIVMITPEEGQKREDFIQKIQMEISAGRGPDLIGTDLIPSLDAYARNGYLECLDEKLDVSAVMSSVLEDGKRGGKLYGAPYSFVLDFAAYRRSDVGEKSFITPEEFMKSVRDSGVKAVQKYAYNMDIVVKYGLWDRSNKAYIDWEKGESHLTEEPFLELLKFAGKYGFRYDDGDLLESKDYFAVGQGHGLFVYSFYQVKAIYEELDGEAAMIGYPGVERGGIYLSSSMLGVNSNSARKEGALAFLNFLLTQEGQDRYIQYADLSRTGYYSLSAFPVNESSLESLLVREKERDEAEIERAGEYYTGTPYAEDSYEQFLFLVRHASIVDEDTEAVANMAGEELPMYFSGDKTAEQVAETLNSRVQLYLNEK